MLTTSDVEKDVVGRYDLGANSYVRKPVEFARFADAARQLGLNELPAGAGIEAVSAP
jgi:two-component system response regulator